MHDALLTLLTLLALVGLVAALASRLRIPPPLVLVLVGAGAALLPGGPLGRHVRLSPELILIGFLPPLLYADAFETSWIDFRRWMRPILMLAVGLVAATILVVGVTTKFVFPELPWVVCFILGAIVAPTDTVAAQAVLQSAPLPRRATAILGGESLVNDATGLVGVQIGVAVALTGVFDAGEVGLRFAVVAGVGVLVGAVVGAVFSLVNRFVRDTTALFALSVLAPYVAFLAADRCGASGVLAVVTAGFIVAWRIHLIPAESRQQLRATWGLLTALLNGFCFLYIGFEVPQLMRDQNDVQTSCMWAALGVASAVIVTRIAWVFPGAYLPLLFSRRLREREGGYPSWKAVLLTGWCGMRGAVSLAAALALPVALPDGTPFPGRDQLLFTTVVVIAATLLVQGVSLRPLVQLLRIPPDDDARTEARRARARMLEAGIQRLDAFCSETSCPIAVHHLRHAMADQLAALEERDAAERELALRRVDVSHEVQRAVQSAQYAELLGLRDAGTINDKTYDQLLIELDRAFAHVA